MKQYTIGYTTPPPGSTPNNEWKTLTPEPLKSGFSYMMTASEVKAGQYYLVQNLKIEITIAATATTAQQEQAINTFISIYRGL